MVNTCISCLLGDEYPWRESTLCSVTIEKRVFVKFLASIFVLLEALSGSFCALLSILFLI